jgi:heme/copper-type cytochrome/quinol oxidase subunit 4
MRTAPSEMTGGIERYLIAYVCILVFAGLQFVVAYSNIGVSQMVPRMLLLAACEAVVAVLFFMHLWGEKRGFVLFVAVITLFVLAMMQYGWSDSFRLLTCGGRCS